MSCFSAVLIRRVDLENKNYDAVTPTRHVHATILAWPERKKKGGGKTSAHLGIGELNPLLLSLLIQTCYYQKHDVLILFQ